MECGETSVQSTQQQSVSKKSDNLLQALLNLKTDGLKSIQSPSLNFKIPDVPSKIGKVVSGASMSTNDLSNNASSPPASLA